MPVSAPKGIHELEVTITGSDFGTDSGVRFLVTGTDDPGGVTVKRVAYQSATKLVALIQVSASVALQYFDIEIQLANGETARGDKLFVVTQATAANTFGRTGAEMWRRRASCKKGHG